MIFLCLSLEVDRGVSPIVIMSAKSDTSIVARTRPRRRYRRGILRTPSIDAPRQSEICRPKGYLYRRPHAFPPTIPPWYHELLLITDVPRQSLICRPKIDTFIVLVAPTRPLSAVPPWHDHELQLSVFPVGHTSMPAKVIPVS